MVCRELRLTVWKHEEIERAAKYDHLQTAQWLFERSGRFGGDEAATNLGTILVAAARIGDMGAIEWVYGQSRQRGVGITLITAEVSLDMAMLNGHRDAIRFATDNFGGSFNGGCLNATIKNGHLDIAQEVQARTGSRRISAECLIKPAARGQIDMVEWVLTTFELTDRDRLEAVLTVAAEAGCLDIIKRIHKICPSKCRTNPIDVAAKRGHLEVIKWLHANRHDQGCSMAMNYAAFNGHLGVAQWLHENRSEGCSPAALTWAAQANHIDVVKWIVAVRPERWGTSQSSSDQAILDAINIAINAAAGHGHLEIVKWLHEQHGDGSSNSDAVAAAARNGHLVVAKWLYNNNFKCTAEAFDLAAGGGHLEIVKWLHSIGCACSARAMDWAAGNGHLEIVKWLHTNRTEGCTGDAFRRAAWHKRASVFKWLFANKPEQLTIDRTQMAAAVVGGDLEIVMLVCQQMSGGWEFLTSLMTQALQYKHYEVFEWLLLEHGHGFAHVDEWLQDEMQTSCDAYAMDIMQALLIRSVSG